MPQCRTINEADDFAGMPNSTLDATKPTFLGASDVSTAFTNMINEQNAHFAELERVSSIIDEALGSDVSAETRATLNNAQVQHITNGLIDMVERANKAANRDKLENITEPMNRMAKATVHDLSWWARLAQKTASILTNNRAALTGYMQKYFGVEGSHVDMHPVIQNANQARADYAGVMTRIQNFINDTFGNDPELLKLAKDTGYDMEVMLEAGGHYRNLQHALDRNAYGYERMKNRLDNEIDGEIALAIAEDKPSVRQKLLDEKKQLERMVNDYVNFAEAENKPGNVYMPSGYTNAQARYWLANYDKATGIPMPGLKLMADKMGQFSTFVENLLIDNGVIPPDMVAGLGNLPPAFTQSYVPYRTRRGNQSGALNDSDVYTSRKYQAFSGMTERPDSAWQTLQFFAHRAAKDIGYKSFGQSLWGALRAGMDRTGAKFSASNELKLVGGVDGMQAYRYDKLLAAMLGSDSSESAINARVLLNTREGGGGIVTTVPILQKDGTTKMERVLINFDKNWEDPNIGVRGSDLNRALSVDEIRTDESRFAKSVTAVTSSYGQMFTRFTPSFAPINGIRDVAERLVNMMARDYLDENGNYISGWTLAPKYAMNTTRAFSALYDIVTKSIDPQSDMGKIWAEYSDSGLYMNPSRHVGLENQPSRFNPKTGKVERRFVDKLLDSGGGAGRKALAVLDGWNDWYNNIASFAHYMTLREAGVPQRRAASGVLEMMNLYNRGTGTDLLRALYPFVKPTLQSGVALSRTLGLAPNAMGQFRPNMKGVATFLGLYGLASQLYAGAHKALGQDEDGNWRADTLSMSQWQSFWPIAIGDNGEYFKVANGFGLIQAAITAAVGMDRVERGLMTPEDYVFEMLFAVGKNVTPGNFPDFNMSSNPAAWFTRLIAPSPLMPIVELATNTNYLGGRIYYEKDQWSSKADSGQYTTQKNYHEFAKLVRDTTGGYLDLAPEQIRSLLNSLAIGPLRLITTMVESGDIGVTHGELRRKDTKRTTAVEDVGPWWTAMGATRFYGKTGDTNRSLFYQALNAMQARARADGVDMSSQGAGSKEEGDEKRRQALRNAGWSEEDVNDAVMLWRAERDLRNIAKDFSGEFKQIWINAQSSDDIKPAMDKFAKDRIELFRRVVQSLNFYRKTRETR